MSRLIGRKGPMSPFSCLIETVLSLKDEKLQISFFEVVWLDRLVFWKIDTFGRFVFLTRMQLPAMFNLACHLSLGFIFNQSSLPVGACIIWGILQLLVTVFLNIVKIRQARATALFYRIFYNYVDIASIILSFVMSIFALRRRSPSPVFVAYSTPILWVDLVLTLRIYERAGVLLILITEMIKGVLPFLGMLSMIVIGGDFSLLRLIRRFCVHSRLLVTHGLGHWR